jgi:hypothetical protein
VDGAERMGRKSIKIRITAWLTLTFSLPLRFALRVLGAIFREDQKDSHYDLAFKFAVHKINKDQHILPKTTLIYDIQYVKADDSFHANKQGRYQIFAICRSIFATDAFD